MKEAPKKDWGTCHFYDASLEQVAQQTLAVAWAPETKVRSVSIAFFRDETLDYSITYNLVDCERNMDGSWSALYLQAP